ASTTPVFRLSLHDALPIYPEVAPWMRAIITSTVDADMLDYLKRDSYFAGLRQQYDERVYHYFHVVDGRLALNLTRHGLLRADARDRKSTRLNSSHVKISYA